MESTRESGRCIICMLIRMNKSDVIQAKDIEKRMISFEIPSFFCHGDEENGHRACTNGHLTTADQSEIRKAYLASVSRITAVHMRT